VWLVGEEGCRRVAGGGSFGGMSARVDGGEVHLDGGLGPRAAGLGGTGWVSVRGRLGL
jgi:hypothetical protein